MCQFQTILASTGEFVKFTYIPSLSGNAHNLEMKTFDPEIIRIQLLIQQSF